MFKIPQVVIKFHGSKSVNGVMKIVMSDARDIVKLAATDRNLNRQVTLDLKELLAIAEHNEMLMHQTGINHI